MQRPIAGYDEILGAFEAASRQSRVKRIALLGHAAAHSPQKMQWPRSSCGPGFDNVQGIGRTDIDAVACSRRRIDLDRSPGDRETARGRLGSCAG